MGVIQDYLVKEEGFTLEQVKLALTQWRVEPMMHKGVQIGETMMQNNEIHFALNKEFRGVIGRKAMLHDVVDGLIDKHGFLVTKLYKNDKHKRLIALFGFKKTHEDEQHEYFWLDRETKDDRHSHTKA
jgi:hypothetical protein